ncbi:AAA family ATPase [Blautia sp. MSJ-19]|uniref:AAA family ATPase n=1 Tax=Blautia sp. MSJ-19 TaxID=2841517 RepID=UPI002ED451AC
MDDIMLTEEMKLPLPVGISDYRRASEEYYYVDKTLMIRDILNERPMVSLFTRPRRFGKTLNMDMLRTFFEKTEEDTSIYFKDKKIWKCGEKYREYQGKYPVIFLTFKDVKRNTWEETYDHILLLISEEYQRHSEILESNICNEYEKEIYRRIAERTANSTDYMNSLKNLSEMLHKQYGETAIIIIDEYDTPIQQGHVCGFYDQVVSFMRIFFSGAFKDNRHLAFGFLTGILRVARESIFSGLNNLIVNSVLDRKYSEYFGFTRDEVAEMASYYNAQDCMEELCEWYDGYCFGKTEIFNPWSVINYFSHDCEARAYWVSTSSNDIIGEILAEADEEIWNSLTGLLQGEKLLTYIDTSVVYPQIKKNVSSVYSFLLMSGYLKTTGKNQLFGAGYMCEVALPNKEILFVYQKEILDQLEYMIPQTASIGVQQIEEKQYDMQLRQQNVKHIIRYGVAFSGKNSEVVMKEN